MRIILLFFILFSTLLLADDINTRTFTKVLINGNETTNIFGDTLVIGNQLLCENDSDGETCQEPDIGATNNSINQHKVRIDTTEGAPLSNSMARLDLQPGDKIIWAGLYWSARLITDTTDNPGADEIYMKTPGSDSYTKYTSISDKYNWFYDESEEVFDYACMQEVTDAVANAGAGEYYVGGIQATDGENRFASWALLVVVENYNREFRNISVYDGFEAVYGSSSSYPDSVTVTADGFLTPRDGTVNSSLIVYTGESESGLDDSATITDSSGEAHYLVDAYDDPNDVFNASISTDGVFRSDSDDPGIADPNFQNVIGTDIDKLQIDVLDNLQTSTDITISSDNDRYTLNMFALSTELYVPKFCYDYAYKQQGVYFTENNDGSKLPRLVGEVQQDEPIEVTIFIRNLVDSDLNVTDMNVSVIDINTTQLTYDRNTTKLALNSSIPIALDDSDLEVDDSYIKEIPVGTMSSNDYFYTYYTLNPHKIDLNDSIQVTANYNLIFDEDTTIPYSLILGLNMQMCSTSNFTYAPATGIYNIVHEDYYKLDEDSDSEDHYYNLPTQVTQREGNFKVLVIDPDDPDHNTLLSDHNITYVDVEMIDASAFHDTNASCNEQASSISETVGLIIDANITSHPFDKQTIQDAIDSGFTDLTQTSDFYLTARQNSAFRVIYYENAFDQGNQPAYKQTEDGFEAQWDMNWEGTNCVGDVNGNGNSDNNDKVSNYCQDGHSISSTDVMKCTRCVSYPVYVCSRDNFAIRPEAFNLKLDDQNQSDTNMTMPMTNGYTGAVGASPLPALELAADYNYKLEINASNHIDNSASYGYTRSFNYASPNDIAEYRWEPRVTLAAGACADESNKSIEMRFVNGMVDINSSVAQAGDYRLHILDTTWTAVDNDTNFMTHHSDTTYFLHNDDGTIAKDCSEYTASTEPLGSSTLNGCWISSSNLNPSNSYQYNDFNVTFHPYEFSLNNSVTFGRGNAGEGVSPSSSFKPFVYMANLSDDENISVHLNTTITAKGKNGTTLTNYTDGCFAKPLIVDLNITAKTLSPTHTLQYNYIVHRRDSNGTIVTAPTDTNTTLTVAEGNNVTIAPNFSIASSFFDPDKDGNPVDMNGSAQVRTNLNFGRDVNVSLNPQDLNYTTISAEDNATLLTADLNTSYYAEGNTTVNQRILHYYGRTIAPKITVICNNTSNSCLTGMSATNNNSMKEIISYAIYCNNSETTCKNDPIIGNVPNGAEQVADARWYENTAHDKLYTPGTDGTIGPISEVANTGKVSEVLPRDLSLTPNNYEEEVIIKYTGPLPYDARMQMQSSPWLIYNEKDANATTNEFFIRFTGDNEWSGKYEKDSTTDTKFSPQTSRRIMW